MKKYTRVLSFKNEFIGKEGINRNAILTETACMLFATACNELGKVHNAREYVQMAYKLAKESENYSSLVEYGKPLLMFMNGLPEEYNDIVDKVKKEIKRHSANYQKIRDSLKGQRFRELTVRETEVAVCVSNGRINREISEDLGISENTVKSTLQRIFSKLEISSRRQLADLMKNEWE